MKTFFGLFTLIIFKRIRENRLIKAKTHKRCKGDCTEVKPLDGFAKAKKGKFGRYFKCKDCKNAYWKKRNATAEGKAAQKKRNDKCKADPVRYAAKLKQHREYMAKKRATPEGMLKNRCADRICQAKHDLRFTWGPLGEDLPRNAPGPDSTFNLLGIVSYEKYVKYLTKMFYGGMVWAIFQVDHIKPLCSFNLSDPEERTKAFHYTNTRPLFAKDNKAKVAQDKKWKEEEHHLHWDCDKWILKANWELIDENDKYGLNKYQRKGAPAAKRRKLEQPSIDSFFCIKSC